MLAGPYALVLLLKTLVAGIIARTGGAWTVAVFIFVSPCGREGPLAATTACGGCGVIRFPLVTT